MPSGNHHLLASLGLLALAAGCSEEDTFPRENLDQFHGVVRDSATLAPLADTELLYREGGDGPFHHLTSSDSSGAYAFERGLGLPPGFLRFSRPGYSIRDYDITAQAAREADDRWRLDAFLARTPASSRFSQVLN